MFYTETYNGHPSFPHLHLNYSMPFRYNYKLFQFQFEHDYGMAQNRINLDYGDKATPEFHLFNLRVSKNFRIKSTVIQLSVV